MPAENVDRYQARSSRVLEYIGAHLGEELDLDRLSAVAAFSSYHFHRQFRQQFGDLVSVGPGLHGDLDGSCEFPQAAEKDEELGFLVCADVPNTNAGGARICLNKAVTVASVEGAESTIIDACGSSFAVVVYGSNSRFGLPHRGSH